jgi:hypothetical protein
MAILDMILHGLEARATPRKIDPVQTEFEPATRLKGDLPIGQ